MRFDNITGTDEPESTESVTTAGCEAQNGGRCIQLLDNVYTVADDVSEDSHVMKCSTVTDDDETVAAASSSADAELADNSLLSADSGSVQVPVNEVANDVAADNVDIHDEPPAVANEPQQPAADAEIAEAVGNIIPAPLAVLAPQGLGDVHQALMQGGGPVGFQPYKHPNLFALRVSVAAVQLLKLVVIIL